MHSNEHRVLPAVFMSFGMNGTHSSPTPFTPQPGGSREGKRTRDNDDVYQIKQSWELTYVELSQAAVNPLGVGQPAEFTLMQLPKHQPMHTLFQSMQLYHNHNPPHFDMPLVDTVPQPVEGDEFILCTMNDHNVHPATNTGMARFALSYVHHRKSRVTLMHHPLLNKLSTLKPVAQNVDVHDSPNPMITIEWCVFNRVAPHRLTPLQL